MQSPTDTNRRRFLAHTASAATFASMATVIPGSALGLAGTTPPSEKIGLGVIGIGPRCTYDLKSMLQFHDVQCLAISDVQASRRNAGKKLVDGHYGNSDCRLYGDFRELLDRKDIDAVLIATGDRWHAAASILAAKAGKDVYSEKPCGITIADCQLLAETMKSEQRVFQAGTQRRSVPNFQQAVDLVHTGKLGKLHTMHASVYVPVLDNTWLPAQPLPPRNVVDWNLWLGPAAWRPFNQRYVDGGWRGQWDFDSGARLLDWGAHTVDLCQWANQADDTMPLTYEPQENHILCEYANGVRLLIDFLPQPFGDRSPHYLTRLGTCPVRLIGEEGSVETGDEGELLVTPKSLQKQLPDATKRVRGLDVGAHSRNFFDCMRSRQATAANPDVMRRSHIACHAAAIAWILKRKLTVDPVREEFVDDDEANRMRSRRREIGRKGAFVAGNQTRAGIDTMRQFQPIPSDDQLRQSKRDLRFYPATVTNPQALTPTQVENFNEQGYVTPLRILDEEDIKRVRQYFDRLLDEVLTAGGTSYSISSAHLRYGDVYDLLCNARIIAYVSDLLGDDVIAWGSHFFCKLPGDMQRVAWHQDASYWPLTPSKAVTVWLAIDDADPGNGCMKFIAGSHHHGHLTYRPSHSDEHNVLNQTVEDAEQFGPVVWNPLRAGEASIHSDLLLHGSEANPSDRRRCGLTLRYCAASVRAGLDWNQKGVHVRGSDETGHWSNNPRP